MNSPRASQSQSSRTPENRSGGQGHKTMMLVSGAVLAVLTIINDVRAMEKHGSLWPIFVAILAFLYLWWLSSLLFDLLFVWHRYIQGDAAHKFLRQHVRRKDLSSRADPPPQEPLGGKPAKLPPKYPLPGGTFVFDEGSEERDNREGLGA